MITAGRRIKTLAAAMATVIVIAGGAFAQSSNLIWDAASGYSKYVDWHAYNDEYGSSTVPAANANFHSNFVNNGGMVTLNGNGAPGVTWAGAGFSLVNSGRADISGQSGIWVTYSLSSDIQVYIQIATNTDELESLTEHDNHRMPMASGTNLRAFFPFSSFEQENSQFWGIIIPVETALRNCASLNFQIYSTGTATLTIKKIEWDAAGVPPVIPPVVPPTGGDTAYVPFLVNANATVTAQQGSKTVSMPVMANVEKILAIPLGSANSTRYTNGARKQLNAPVITGSRGNITLRLPAQSYKNAEISLYSVNGKRIMRGKAAASETVSGISRRNIAAGVYMLSVKGIDGSAFTNRLTHSGGNMNINIAFGAEPVYSGANQRDLHSSARQLGKQAAAGDWEITVAAAGYAGFIYALNPVAGHNNPTQVITLTDTTTPPPSGYTVTFNANGGSGTVSSLTAAIGSSVTLPDGSGLTKNGYTFGVWSLDSSGWRTNYSAGSSYTPTGNVTLYARWVGIPTPTITTFVDSRDNKTYNKVTIGAQTWMAENLNYNASGSVCYNNSADSCAKYGRLYNWSTAMNGAVSSSSNPSGVRGVCPVGWHLPSHAEWTQLTDYVGGASAAIEKLRSTSGWNGTDEYGFAALPGGYSDGSFTRAGFSGGWRSATHLSATNVVAHVVYVDAMTMSLTVDYGENGRFLFSVRCVQD